MTRPISRRTAAGLIVTRASSSGSLTEELGGQLGAHPKAIGIAAGAMGVVALIPGIPALPFMGMGIGLGYLAYRLSEGKKEKAKIDAVAAKDKSKETSEDRKSTRLNSSHT